MYPSVLFPYTSKSSILPTNRLICAIFLDSMSMCYYTRLVFSLWCTSLSLVTDSRFIMLLFLQLRLLLAWVAFSNSWLLFLKFPPLTTSSAKTVLTVLLSSSQKTFVYKRTRYSQKRSKWLLNMKNILNLTRKQRKNYLRLSVFLPLLIKFKIPI